MLLYSLVIDPLLHSLYGLKKFLPLLGVAAALLVGYCYVRRDDPKVRDLITRVRAYCSWPEIKRLAKRADVRLDKLVDDIVQKARDFISYVNRHASGG